MEMFLHVISLKTTRLIPKEIMKEMLVKVHYLDNHIHFQHDLRDLSEEQREQLHQDIKQ